MNIALEYAYSATFAHNHFFISKREEKKDHNYPDGPSEIPFFRVLIKTAELLQ